MGRSGHPVSFTPVSMNDGTLQE